MDEKEPDFQEKSAHGLITILGCIIFWELIILAIKYRKYLPWLF